MATFRFGLIPFSEMTADAGDPLTTTSTTGAVGAFTVDADRDPIAIDVEDDEDEFDDAFIDPGADQVLTTPITINGTNFAVGSVVELEFAITTVTGETFYYVRIDGVNVGMTGTTLPQPGVSYVIASSQDGQDEPYANIPCFTSGTKVMTPSGERAVETLVAGDLVRTGGDGFQPVRWVGRRSLTLDELDRHPELAPVAIARGALGNRRELKVSPQHRILVSGWAAELNFGEESVLVSAKALINGKTICQPEPDGPVTYVHLLFDRHQVLETEGLLSESFHPGDQGASGLTSAARIEILSLFPDLARRDSPHFGTAYPVLRRYEAALLEPSA